MLIRFPMIGHGLEHGGGFLLWSLRKRKSFERIRLLKLAMPMLKQPKMETEPLLMVVVVKV